MARIGSSTVAGPVELRKGDATLDLRGLSAGTYVVNVTYLGSAEYAASSDRLELTVAPTKTKN